MDARGEISKGSMISRRDLNVPGGNGHFDGPIIPVVCLRFGVVADQILRPELGLDRVVSRIELSRTADQKRHSSRLIAETPEFSGGSKIELRQADPDEIQGDSRRAIA
jgi:hypothetical protein